MKILAINGMASLQDLGRFGHRTHGIGVNGAMDGWALQAGNALLKNPPNTAAIELTLGSLTVEFDQPTTFCLMGAMYEATLDGTPVANGWRVQAKTGQVLTLARAVSGMHLYLCVQGGFDISPILHSTSTNIKAAFGGYQGRFLQAGDNLPSHQGELLPAIGITPIPDFLSSFVKDINSKTHYIRILPNSEYDAFTPDSQNVFTSQPWKLLSSSNRMGYRLQGDKLELNEPLQMNSHGVDVGMIQVPPQGQPIVLMADTQTTGGYPKITTVIKADIGKMAQIRFGQSCQFVLVTLEQALHAYADRLRYLKRIETYANEL